MSTVPTPAPRRLIGVGVGPGDPTLTTIKAALALRAADVVLVPATEASGDGPGRAELIVAEVAPDARIRRIPFSMADRSGVSDRRKEAWLTSASAALEEFDGGAQRVAFATVGDPSVYSTFSYLAAHVVESRQGVEVEVIPGITAMQALAAESKTPLVEGQEILALVPVTVGLDRVRELLGAADTVVAYKGGRKLPELVRVLREEGRDAVLGVNVSLEGQRLVALDDLTDDERAPYFSTVLSAPRRTGTGGAL
ncbi:precorrin-2 C(20)-methyltransferase [Tessaracoccus sp. Y36]|uniref:precorrin-2 C(20)-methyltransferase n=1 Tax=Tessaracoccus sp. MC1756 TaxID=2760311 RepID=UPI001600D824|nr:precorrin-2 C(20)-methyltransferase [Tessaracoccus sp. MC1756]